MSDHASGDDSRREEAPSDEDQDDASEGGTRVPTPSPDSKEGIPTGEAKAAINREVDPPA
jgi:hypothetical protein